MNVKSLVGVSLCILASLIACQHVPDVLAQPQHLLTVTIDVEPPTEQIAFGIYSTMFPVNLLIHICNNVSTDDFPGGYLTGAITPPAGENYHTALNFSVTSLTIGKCEAIVEVFKPAEPGVHTVSLDVISTHASYNPIWQVSEGFLAFTVEPVSTMIGVWSLLVALALGGISILVSFMTPFYQERWKQRRLVKTHRRKAYSRLYDILERYGATASTPSLELTRADFTELQKIVEDSYDVLYPTTRTAWRDRKLEKILEVFKVEAGAFFNDIQIHYARLDKRNPYHDSDSQ